MADFQSPVSKYVKVPSNAEMYFSKLTQSRILGRNPSAPLQESKLRPSDYWFGCFTSELQETRGSETIVTWEYSEEI